MSTPIGRRARPSAVVAETKLHVTSSELGRDAQQVLEVRKFEVDPAFVRVSAGVTKQTGQPYESFRIDVSITAPCYPEEIDSVVTGLSDRVYQHLDAELKNYGYEGV